MKTKFLLLITIICFCIKPIESIAQVNIQDSLALVDFHDSTYGDRWRNPDLIWDLNTPVNSWTGVGITNNRVTSMNLVGAIDSGRIPSSFGNLTALTRIDFLDNRLTKATLPESFGNLNNLLSIKLHAVFYNLPFPTSVTKLIKLEVLDLADNLFTDTLPSSIGNLTQLKYLELSNCFNYSSISSKIPSEIGNLKNIQNLILYSNNFSGTIPDSFASLDSLELLDVSYNNLSGIIPSGINNLEKLDYLFVNNNAYTFQAIEPLVQAYNTNNSTYRFEYSPQANLHISRRHNKLAVSPGGILSNDTLRWYNADNTLLATIIADTTYTPANTGTYYVTITNSVATQLTLYSDSYTLNLVLADSTTAVTQNITGTSPANINEGIFKLVSLTPTSGTNALNGNVTTTVTIDSIVPTFHGQPYVERHYDITPSVNETNAQATVTLYFTQDEFNNYNNYVTANNLNLPLLPSGGVDNGNVRITQFHGTFAGSSRPENYNNPNVLLITPTVAWDNSNQWWVLTFPVTGFSGFFVSTGNSALPLTLLSFSGKLQNNGVMLQWLTANEVPVREFILEKSIDGNSFNSISNITAQSIRSINNYIYTDVNPLNGINFYRLKMIDQNGETSYSNIIKIKYEGIISLLEIYPNPASSYLNIKITSNKNENIILKITDALGKLILKNKVSVNNGITPALLNIERLSSGFYYFSARVNGKEQKIIFVKK